MLTCIAPLYYFPRHRPPQITAPPAQTLNATGPSGAAYSIPPDVYDFCGVPACTINVVINGTSYPVGANITLPPGNTSVKYVITDAAGTKANSTTLVTVKPYVFFMFCPAFR